MRCAARAPRFARDVLTLPHQRTRVVADVATIGTTHGGMLWWLQNGVYYCAGIPIPFHDVPPEVRNALPDQPLALPLASTVKP